jgi:exodeoxyribonuclease VII small subunit
VAAAERKEAAGRDDGHAVPPSELSYTEATRELDAIVEFFEQREVDVDQLVARLERATAIVDELDRRIHATRSQVEELVPKLEAVSRADRGGSEDDVASTSQSGSAAAEAGDEAEGTPLL